MKELNECTGMTKVDFGVKNKKRTLLIKEAIHRNEVTREVEP
jgi:hypothetical protein